MWGQADLAREAGITPNALWRIETGRVARPRMSTIRKIAKVLGVDPSELRDDDAPGG